MAAPQSSLVTACFWSIYLARSVELCGRPCSKPCNERLADSAVLPHLTWPNPALSFPSWPAGKDRGRSQHTHVTTDEAALKQLQKLHPLPVGKNCVMSQFANTKDVSMALSGTNGAGVAAILSP